ncbi:MAG: hypothetical protein ACRYFX_17980 [Janthinobacterium lividum]
MWYSKQLRLVRRARKIGKTQQSDLFAIEMEGIVSITLRSATGELTIPIERAAGAQVVDTLRDTLRDRRRTLKQEARQLRQDWQESERLHARKKLADRDQLPADGRPPQ